MNIGNRDLLKEQFRALIEAGLEQGDVLNILAELDPAQKDHDGTIEAARANYCNDDLEIDDTPLLSPTENGCWVSAWVWVAIDSEITPEPEARTSSASGSAVAEVEGGE